MKKHLLQGALPKKIEENSGLIGAEILNRLDGVIFTANPEQVTIYAASRDAKISMQAYPFNTNRIALSGSINFNREVNREAIIIPLETATDLLDYKEDITRFGIQLKPGSDLEEVKAEIQHIVGKQFKVKTNFEKNALIFKTSKIEKIIVFCILIFIFILAAFNMVASLTMLFIEKKKNLKTMMAFGLYQQSIFSIFFLQGCMICFFGVFCGIFLGYGVVAIQYFGEVLTIPDSGGEIFPVGVKLMDIGLILLVTLVSGVVSAWIPVRILVNRFLKAND
jgi:lipoprotein-releasing system permease protein